MKMSLVPLATVLLASSVSLAKPLFIANGRTMSQGAAEEMKRKDPSVKVYKITAQEVAVDGETGNLKKTSDVSSIESLRELIK